MDFLVAVAVSGIAAGCIYALVALSFNIVYRTTGALNFAVGHLAMLGAYVATSGTEFFGGNALGGASLAVVVLMVVGLLLGSLVYIPLRRRNVLWFIVATLGVGAAIQNLVIVIWGPQPHSLQPLLPLGTLAIGGAHLPGTSITVILVVAMALPILLFASLKTVMGIRFRATAQDEEAAELVGIDTSRVALLAFVIGVGLAGLAGVLLAPITLVTPVMGGPLVLKGFIAVVIGGFGNLTGAVVGGLALGVAEAALAYAMSSSVKEMLLFGALILFLVFKPQGILGEEAAERA